jgi:hypothetical protein
MAYEAVWRGGNYWGIGDARVQVKGETCRNGVAWRMVAMDNSERGESLPSAADRRGNDEAWLRDEGVLERVRAGLAWAEAMPAAASNLEEFEEQMWTRWRARRGLPSGE